MSFRDWGRSCAFSLAALFVGTARVAGAEIPVLLDLPAALSVVAGQPLAVDVLVYSGGPISRYEWFKGELLIDGQTTAALRLGAATASMAGTYRARVTTAAGSATTNDCVVTVVPATPPKITRTPVSQAVFLTEAASFSVEASGSTPFTYEWRRDGVVVFTNPVDNTFELLSTRPNDAGTYTVTARNVAGAATSASFKLTVMASSAPVITRHPLSQTAPYNVRIGLDATVVGATPWISTWRKDGVVVAETKSGAPRLSLADVAATPEKQSGTYTLTVSNRFGSVVSDPAVVDFEPPVAPFFRRGPISQTIKEGEFGNLDAWAGGSEPLTYQWRKDGVAIVGAAGSLSYPRYWTAHDAGRYTLVMSNPFGTVESEPAIVRIRTIPAGQSAPIIARHPSILTALVGGSASFVVWSRSNVGEFPTYQWQREGQPIAGATKDFLTVANITAADAADYRCVVTDKGGSTTTHPAHLTVLTSAVNGFARQPGDQSCAVGEYCEFEIEPMFARPAPGAYRVNWWRTNPDRRANTLSGGNSFAIYSPTSADTGDYFAEVETFDYQQKPTGAFRSAVFHLEVRENLPEIARHPENFSLSEGSRAVLDVQLFESAGVTYQWYRNGTAVPGAIKSDLLVDPINASTVGYYTVVASNSRGSVTSEPGHVTMTAAPAPIIITAQPASVAASLGGSTSLSVTTSGSRIYKSYPTTWYHDGAVVPAATSEFLSLSSVRLGDEGTYYAVVHSPDGDLTSRSARLTVLDQPDAPAIVTAPVDIQVRPGQLASLAVAASGSEPLHYSWFKDGRALPDSDRPVLTWAAVNAADAGAYRVVISNDLGSVTSSLATLQVKNTSRIANLSARVQIGTGDAIAITGFVVRGAGEKRLLLRGIGPALLDAGVTHAIGITEIRLHNSAGNMIGTNPVWYTLSYPVPLGRAEMVVTGAEVGAFPINGYSGDAAMVTRLEAGAYSVHAAGLNDASGIGLVEVYDADREGSSVRLVNLSCRASVGTGERVAITGLVIDGEGSQRVLLRVAGPALLGQGVVNALKRPRLELFDVRGTSMAANEQWETGNDRATIATVAGQVGAFSFAPGSNDAALLVTLPPGVYSAIASGVGATEGIALIEVYEVP